MKIVLATGGSGGHIFPALKTAEFLKQQGHQIYFAGALISVELRLQKMGYEHLILDVEGFQVRSIVRFITKLIIAITRCRKWIQEIKPDVVVGFGSYSSFPAICAARFLGIRSMIHEQNVVPGKANRMASYFVKTVAVSFKETKKFFPRHNVVWTGCPCNSQRPAKAKSELLKVFGLKENYKTVLVLGGSQGSHYLNQVFFDGLSLAKDIQVIHMTGKKDEEDYRRKYASLQFPSCVSSFIDEIECAYAVADLVIARAGAGTVTELASLGVPSILIPYPYAHGHQMANARVLEKAGNVVIIEQSKLNSHELFQVVNRLLQAEPSSRNQINNEFVSNPTQTLSKTICLVS